jgi:hypothetical protein
MCNERAEDCCRTALALVLGIEVVLKSTFVSRVSHKHIPFAPASECFYKHDPSKYYKV